MKEKVKAALEAEGLVISSVGFTPIGECNGKSATLLCSVWVSDGFASAQFNGVGSGTDSSDKAPMKACAAALKYALTSGFLIPTGDDPEDDSDTPVTDATQKASDLANKTNPAASSEVSEATWIARINSAPDADALASLKLGISAIKGKDLAQFNRIVEVYREKGKTFK